MQFLQFLAGIIAAVLIAIWSVRVTIGADNARHLEDIKRQDALRKADAEQERLQREADFAKQKELFENERKLREAEEAELKNTLVMSMLVEIHAVQEFLVITAIPHIGVGYSIEVGAITQTLPQQVKYFQRRELVSKLTEYRAYLSKLTEACDTLNELGNGHLQFPGEAPAYMIVTRNWNGMNNEGKKLNHEVFALLLPEYNGEVPKELAKLRVG